MHQKNKGTCNFTMSMVLLGLKWKGNGEGRLPNNFLIHRFVKLAKTYYPFLLLMFIFYGVVTDYPLTAKDFVMHIAFLPWFDKLHGFGHLWFMTMIVICYVGVYIINRISFKIRHYEPHFTYRGGGKFIFILCITSLIFPLHHLMLSYGLPGQMLLYLWFFVLCFYHAVDVVTWMQNVNWKYVIFASFIIGCSFFISHAGLYDSNRLLVEWLGVLNAIAVAMIVLKTCQGNRTNQIVSFVSGISLEIYLVHHNFAFGKYSIVNYVGNAYVGLIALFAFSILAALFLKKLSEVVTVILRIHA